MIATRLSYQFSNIKLSDDPLECTSNSEIIKGIGTVIMKVWRVKLIPRRIDSPSGWPAPTPSGRPIINEKLKKGMIPHTTGFGDSITTPTWKQPSTDRRRMESVPWLTFTFNYRSREVLELQSIIEEEAPVIPLLPAAVDVEPIDNKRSITLLDDSEGEEAGQGGGLAERLKQESRVKAEKIGKVRKKREIIILSDSD